DEPIYLIQSDEAVLPGEVPVAKSIDKHILLPVPDNMLPPAKPVHKPVPVPIPDRKPVSKNKSKLMILFNNEQSPYLKKKEEALLQKILSAIQLTIDDVELVN